MVKAMPVFPLIAELTLGSSEFEQADTARADSHRTQIFFLTLITFILRI